MTTQTWNFNKNGCGVIDKQKRGLKQQIERFHQNIGIHRNRHVRLIGDDNGEPWDNLRYRIFRENQMVIPE